MLTHHAVSTLPSFFHVRRYTLIGCLHERLGTCPEKILGSSRPPRRREPARLQPLAGRVLAEADRPAEVGRAGDAVLVHQLVAGLPIQPKEPGETCNGEDRWKSFDGAEAAF